VDPRVTRALPLDDVAEGAAAPPTGVGRRLALNTLVVGGAFVLSRVLGLVREAVIAGQFGLTGQLDAYIAAFRIPDTLFLLIIGGAVGSAFIPVFTSLMSRGDGRAAWRLASTLINASVVLLSLGALLMGVLAEPLVGAVLFPGRPPEQQALVVDLTRIILLSPLFMGLGGWAQGILNARQHFTMPALAPVFYNLAIIAGALFLAPVFGVYGLAWGVVAGAILHFAVQVPALVRVGMRWRPRLSLRDEGVGEVGRLILPRIAGQAAFQVNIVAMTSYASFLVAGSLSAFNYAYMLMILPHGVFAMSLATTTWPTMASQFAEGDLDGLRGTLSRAVRVLLFLVVPATVGMFVLREELVATLFQLGAFDAQDTRAVAGALGFFCLGLVSYAVVEVVTRAFYALHDTASPVAVGVVTVALNLGLAWALAVTLGMGANGLALSLAVTTTLEMVLLWVLLGRKLPGWWMSTQGMMRSAGTSLLSAGAMGVVLWAMLTGIEAWLPGEGKLQSAVVTVVGVAAGAAVYLLAAKLLRSEEMDQAIGMVARRLRRRA
jgi:putative peptidoglycan lipid II flippase